MNSCVLPAKPEEIERFLLGFDFFERYVHGRAEGEEYVRTHARRFYETLRLTPGLNATARVLELGAIQYYFTILIKKYLRMEVDVVSFYEFEKSDHAVHTVSNPHWQEQYQFQYNAVNVEKDLFPFDDATFDLVFCCEIIEHLLINPSHMLYEIHRVLKPGGYLVLSTPNVLRWGNLFALLRGRNIYDRYLGNGIYGRHNREYAADEISTLLEASGFQIEKVHLRNVYGSEALNKLPVFANRRDNIFGLAKPVERRRMAYPDTLYALADEYRNVVRSSLTMGENEAGHLGRGWHDFESSDPGFRWSDTRAEFFLKNNGARNICLTVCSHHPAIAGGNGVRLSLRVNEQEIGAAKLSDHEWHDLTFELGGSMNDQSLHCVIEVSDSWIPRELTASTDARRLGVGVRQIWLT